MIRLFPARAFYVIILMVIGWSNVAFAQVANNYCVPSLVKENIFFEKLQIGTWIPGLTAGSKVESISVNTFGDADQNYEFSLQGMPQTRDTFYWQIWIDINQDNDFEDGGERFLSTYTSRKQKALGKIHFPNTIRGQYLVRIMLSRSKANNACGTQSKTLDYLDFWLKGSCPAPKPLEQVKVADSTQESILLRFNWPKNTKFNWVLSGKEGVSYSKYGSEVGDSLLIKYLYFENSYQFRYQLQCGELIWSDWSDPVDVGTVYKPTCSQIDINQVKIDEVGFDHVTITVPKQENSEVYWYSISSYEGKGDTVFGSSSYGQSKIPLSLAGAKYHLSVKKACLNDYDSEWTFENLTFTTLPDPCASVFLKINRLGTNSFAQAFPTQRIAYEWRLRLKGNAEWQVSESTSDTLSLSTLDSSSVYEIQVRVKCTPDSWSEWSILQKFSLINSCPKPQLADIKYEQEGMVFKLSYQGTFYRQVIWNEPPASSYLCGPAKDSTKPELTLWLKYGEKLYVRLKGVCKENNEQSDYSDTLWLERPCVAPGLTDFNAVNISDKTMDFLVNAEFCGDYDYMFSQDSLLPNSDWKSFSYRKYPHGNFKELQPGTKYFIKIRRQCYDQEAQSVYSPIKSFVTLNQPKVCQAKAIPKNDIKIEFAEPSTVIIRIKPQSANSHYRVFMTKYDEYVGYFYNAEFRDTVFKLNNLFQDGSYGFTVVAFCGATEAWSEKIDFKPPLSDCPKLNAANIWVNDWNPKGDTIGFEYYSPRQNYVPYMWRYREAGTVIWLDTLISAVHTSLKLTFPKQNRSYEIQLKPVASAACPDNWSDSKKYFVKCLKPTLVSRKVIGTMAEFESNKVNSLYRWRYRLEGESEWKTISTGSEYKLTLSDLKPNSNYELQVQTQCDENEWGDYYTTTFTTKLCFYDSLKISHDYIYPNQIRLKTNLPQEEILSGRPKFNWSMVSPFQGNGITPSKDTCRFFIAPNGRAHQFSLQFACDNLIPDNSKVYNYQVQLLPCVVPSASDIVVHEISSQAITVSVYRNKALQVAQIAYRKVGTQNLTILKLSSNSEIASLLNLEPNTTYELFARILCDPQIEGYSSWSPVKKVTTRKYGLVGDFLATIDNNQVHSVQHFRLIPNPSQGQFNLELPKTIEGLAELSITNLNGQRIYNAQVQISPGATFPMDLSQQPQGVYLVHLRVGNQLYREKLVLIK